MASEGLSLALIASQAHPLVHKGGGTTRAGGATGPPTFQNLGPGPGQGGPRVHGGPGGPGSGNKGGPGGAREMQLRTFYLFIYFLLISVFRKGNLIFRYKIIPFRAPPQSTACVHFFLTQHKILMFSFSISFGQRLNHGGGVRWVMTPLDFRVRGSHIVNDPPRILTHGPP